MKSRWSIMMVFLVAVSLTVSVSCAAPITPAAPTAPAETAPIPPAATEAAESSAAQVQELIIAVAQDTTSLDPACSSPLNQTTSMVYKAIYQTLVTNASDPPYAIEPDLAESWEFSDDFMSLVFRLSQDAVFVNGDPVTASDAAFSIERARQGNPDIAESISSVEVIDDFTLKLELHYADSAILNRLAAGTFSILNSKLVGSDPCSEEIDPSAGSGPYLIDTREPGRIMLARNENYSDDPDRLDFVVIDYVPDDATRAIMLEQGDVDIALDLSTDTMSASGDDSLVEFADATTRDLVFLEANANYVDIDPEIGWLVSNQSFQAAIRYALDYGRYADLFAKGSVTPTSFVPIGFKEAAGEGIQRDLDTARQLLDEAGYKGQKVPLTYLLTPGNQMLAQAIQEDLDEAGLTISLDARDAGLFFQLPYALRLSSFESSYLDADGSLTFLPGGYIADRNGWKNEELQKLREAIRTTTDANERWGLFQQAQSLTNKIGPYAFVVQPGIRYGYDSSISGVSYHPQYTLTVAKFTYKVNCDQCKTWCSQNCSSKKCKKCAPSCSGVSSCP